MERDTMSRPFADFERRIDRVYLKLAGMPREQVVLTRLLFYVFKGVDDRLNQFLVDYNLTSTTFYALVMIYASENNKINPCDLSEVVFSSRTNVTRFADELVERGWVERQPSTEDRRRVELSLTPEGQALVEKVLPVNWELVKRLWKDFSPEELDTFMRLLHKLRHVVNGNEAE
jgi:MarR family transcriptional repressor of emrRAB